VGKICVSDFESVEKSLFSACVCGDLVMTILGISGWILCSLFSVCWSHLFCHCWRDQSVIFGIRSEYGTVLSVCRVELHSSFGCYVCFFVSCDSDVAW
jgi:hypothetical protein